MSKTYIDSVSEIVDMEKEKQLLEYKNELYKNNIAVELKENGLGEEIKETLKNPTIITKSQLLKLKIKNTLKSISDIL